MDDVTLQQDKKEDSVLHCSRCGAFNKPEYMFIRRHRYSKFVLCHACARWLRQELGEYLQSYKDLRRQNYG